MNKSASDADIFCEFFYKYRELIRQKKKSLKYKCTETDGVIWGVLMFTVGCWNRAVTVLYLNR